MNWQPIETAPKDGARVLIYTAETCENCLPNEPAGITAAFYECFVGWVTGRMKSDGYLMVTNHPPTHWMLLPEPPE